MVPECQFPTEILLLLGELAPEEMPIMSCNVGGPSA